MYDKQQTLKIDREHIWHPYTQMKDYAQRDPLVMVRGEGVRLYDADGRMYYDTVASWWCNVHGHGHPRLKQALQAQAEQLEHVLFAGITHPPAAETVDRLQTFLDPALCRFFFSDNGATSTEIALKMAFQYWQNVGQNTKTRFVFLENSYHGDTAGAMSVGGISLYHELYAPLRFKSYQAASPQCRICPHRKSEFTYAATTTGCAWECFASMEKILHEHQTEIAAVIVEPLMQGAAGISFYPPEYLRRLRALTRELDILLILDEVATGFGRLGTFFAHTQAGVVPDLLCLSKGLSAGYLPLALTVTREEIYQAFYSDAAASKTFFHGHTYTANPLACAVAAENLKMLQENGWPESRGEIMSRFREKMRAFEALDCIGDIRHQGFVGAVDLVKSRSRQEAFPSAVRIGYQTYLKSLQNNLLLRPLDNTIYWFLPLVVSELELDAIFEKSFQVIRAVVAAQ